MPDLLALRSMRRPRTVISITASNGVSHLSWGYAWQRLIASQFTGGPQGNLWGFVFSLIGSSQIVLALPKKLVNR